MHIDEAHSYCKKVATGHYENFPVGSMLVPKKYRRAIFAIYAFARAADDFADEIDDKDESRKKLEEWRNYLHLTENGNPPENPVFIALSDVFANHPISPYYLELLLDAFVQDTNVHAYQSWDDLLAYCSKSANPVGRLLLELFDLHTPENIDLSDAICSGLQLINFWQDLSVDIPRGRSYIPGDIWFKYTDLPIESTAIDRIEDRGLIISELVDFTRTMYNRGIKLSSILPGRFGFEISLTIYGGEKILNKVENLGDMIFKTRPTLQFSDWINIFLKALSQ